MVRNDSGSVVIEVEGPRDAIDAFAGALTRDLPPLAVVDSVTTRELARRRGRLPHRGQRRGRGPPHVHPAGRAPVTPLNVVIAPQPGEVGRSPAFAKATAVRQSFSDGGTAAAGVHRHFGNARSFAERKYAE